MKGISYVSEETGLGHYPCWRAALHHAPSTESTRLWRWPTTIAEAFDLARAADRAGHGGRLHAGGVGRVIERHVYRGAAGRGATRTERDAACPLHYLYEQHDKW